MKRTVDSWESYVKGLIGASEVSSNIRVFDVRREDVIGKPWHEILFELGAFKSKSEARRMIAQGGLKIVRPDMGDGNAS